MFHITLRQHNPKISQLTNKINNQIYTVLNYLKETLIMQQILGVDNAFDFVPGRSFSMQKGSIKIGTIKPEAKEIEDNITDETVNEAVAIKKTTPSINLDSIKTFAELVNEIKNFNGCSLKMNATNAVIYDGNTEAKIMLIGEAPGETEDLKGIPFCGQSGQLLRKSLSFIGLNTTNLLITNTVFWRPPLNRKPYADEIEMCLPFVKKMIEIVAPNLVILCGATAINTYLMTTQKTGALVGKHFTLPSAISKKKIDAFAIYHPSYLLRNPSAKKVAWEHLLSMKELLNK
ncbi:MAG: uracil-DNA glycosylase, partial [Rickettsiales bacterium]|nr:uracil-DNA glycosylase [Rickettsiales bacterium]